ncbi:MAG: N-6 DNA methylase, partial [Candidatus Nitrosotenuis sp.]
MGEAFMDQIQARRLIQDTLEAPFDRERFARFAAQLLKKLDYSTGTARSRVYDSFKEQIERFERIGTYTDSHKKRLDVLIVYLVRETTLERARTAQRNFVARYLKEQGEKDAGLVAFVSPDQSDWRFSYVEMEYKLIETESGRIAPQQEFTPARRYSFIVGANEKSHTAQAQLMPLLVQEEQPTLEEIRKSFSVERVTKEFFEKYRELFLRLKESLDDLVNNDPKIKADFDKKQVNTVDFAKKLLGQIVFLYFLQKKGWLGVEPNKPWGSGSKHFLRELFNQKYSPYKNFFNDILEPLFYQALRSERPDDYYEPFKCRIPFLNGGLFDPINDYDWENTNIYLPDDLFSNTNKTEEGDIGDGILDVFDRYNFTVKEDEPLEKEVAVDPEMLGKVFENLLEVKDRKSKGTYYTPREIVHYMCQQSLISYLATELEGKISKEDIETLVKYGETALEHESRVASEGRETERYAFKLPESIRQHAALIDEKLASIRVCDPAVGSGAFPVGMMSEIVRTRLALTPYIGKSNERTPYRFKRECIENSLYGVDIDPGAVEIAKLRLWLSLVVDEEEREKIKPLPNLDYKIVQGDSLLIVKKDLLNEALFDKLEELKTLYFNETSVSKKQEYRKQIDELIGEITSGYKNFDFEVYFSEVFHEKKGFDVVIANPPYIQLQKALDDNCKYADLYKNIGYKTFDRMGDIYCLFYEKGVNLLKPAGHLCYISSNKWMRAGYGEKLRDFFTKYKPVLLIDLGPGVFENATVDTNILLLQKNNTEQHALAALTLQKQNGEVNIDAQVKENAVVLEKLTKGAWFIGSSAEQKLKEKIERIGKPLKEWDVKIYYGIKTGLNEAFIITTEKRNEILANCRDEAERRRTEAIIKPILRGRDIKRYYYEWAGLWVIVIPWHFPLHEDATIQGASDKAEKEFQKLYPAIYKHLLEFKGQLSKRNKDETGIRYEWYALQRCAATYYHEFEKEKVVWQRITQEPTFCLVEPNVFILDSMAFFTGEKLKFIMSVLNSKLIYKYVNMIVHQYGFTGFRLSNQYVEIMPLPPITPANEPIVRQIEELVDKIIAAKKQDKDTDTSEYEKQIDQLVYQLYGLSE